MFLTGVVIQALFLSACATEVTNIFGNVTSEVNMSSGTSIVMRNIYTQVEDVYLRQDGMPSANWTAVATYYDPDNLWLMDAYHLAVQGDGITEQNAITNVPAYAVDLFELHTFVKRRDPGPDGILWVNIVGVLLQSLATSNSLTINEVLGPYTEVTAAA